VKERGRKGARTGLREVRWSDHLVPGLAGRVQAQYERRRELVREAGVLKSQRDYARWGSLPWDYAAYATLFSEDMGHLDLSDDELLELVEELRRELVVTLEARTKAESEQHELAVALLGELEGLEEEPPGLEVLGAAWTSWNTLAGSMGHLSDEQQGRARQAWERVVARAREVPHVRAHALEQVLRSWGTRQEGVSTALLEDALTRLAADAVLVRGEAPKDLVRSEAGAWAEVLELAPGALLLPLVVALHVASSEVVGVRELSDAELETLAVLARDPELSLAEAKESAQALEG
jgi:hypothetical protein